MNTSSLHLRSASPDYKIDPLPIISILDHHKRRTEKQKRVVGSLLGYKDADGFVHITNSFPVPHVETEDQVAMDVEYLRDMRELHEHINGKESVVGWYSTGADITYISALIHKEYSEFIDTRVVPHPVHLQVDTKLETNKLNLRAFHQRSIEVADQQVVSCFEEVSVQLAAEQPDKIGVDVMIKGHPDSDAFDAPATVFSDIVSLEMVFADLLTRLYTISEYVDKAAESGEGEAKVGRMITSALSAIPLINLDTFQKMFSSNMRDLLMSVYLVNLTRTQLALADKISDCLAHDAKT